MDFHCLMKPEAQGTDSFATAPRGSVDAAGTFLGVLLLSSSIFLEYWAFPFSLCDHRLSPSESQVGPSSPGPTAFGFGAVASDSLLLRQSRAGSAGLS